MDPPLGVLHPQQTVAEAVAELRELAGRAMVTYGYVLDDAGKLLGVIVFRELLFAEPHQRLEQVMLRDPFSLNPHRAGPRRHEGRAAPPLPGVPGVRRRRPPRRHRARADAVRGAGVRDQRAAGQDGRCREGGAGFDAVAAEPALPPSLAAVQPAHRLRRRRGRRSLRGDDRPDRGPRGVPARCSPASRATPGARRSRSRSAASRSASSRPAEARRLVV